MAVFSWLEGRSRGFRSRIGDTDRICRSLYSTIEPTDVWTNQNVNNHLWGGVYNLEFSPDGSILAAACEKRSIVLFATNTFKETKIIRQAHTDCVNCVKFLDDRMFASCSDDCSVVLWDVRNLKTRVRTLLGHSNWVKNIEYSKKDNLIVTSGFDGSIFTWDINSTTESGLLYRNVFHTTGLMRCRLTPDASKLVICTTGGYMIIIHDLNLETLAEDLKGFRPNLHRLMQLGRQLIPFASQFTHLFLRSQKENRVELVSDFPEGNDAEVISSLQIHPHGWTALSRNISYDESSEFTCVHDIQDFEEESDTEDDIEKEVDCTIIERRMRILMPDSPLYERNAARLVALRREAMNRENRVTSEDLHPDIWEIQWPLMNRNTHHMNSSHSRLERFRSGIVPEEARSASTPAAGSSSSGTSTIAQMRAATVAAAMITGPRTEAERSVLEDMIVDSGEEFVMPREEHTLMSAKRRRVQQNAKRMLYYIEEPNIGKRFIKELCFSSDGRIICSPYGYGIRLLSFNRECSELSACVDGVDAKAQKLTELKVMKCHSDIVVSTKFNPRLPLLVTGCLNGKIVWLQPVL
ncbi:DDB1- and CUL4-associated factor 10 homolog [Phlebotomus argentipes]|uniref:DDB1- and CUL4-associated factor 10 homolog n=1 Tax=Phlebotomus argentipes TaxID=94469 RepID=UPI00289364F9|nr:DDB1- and CUL4-associated factor 10 homolog [Phlebotomus argentipes]